MSKRPWVYRFAVGNPATHSTIWNLWPGSDRSVYLAPRRLAGDMKISLHPSGRWHYGMTGPGIARFPHMREPDGNRGVLIPRPPRTPDSVTFAWTMFVPGESIVKRKEPVPAGVQWLPPTVPGNVVVLSFVLVPSTTPEREWPGRRQLIARVQRFANGPHGEDLILLYHQREQTPGEHELWHAPIEPAEGSPPMPARFTGDHFALLYGTSSNGSPYVVDLFVRHGDGW